MDNKAYKLPTEQDYTILHTDVLLNTEVVKEIEEKYKTSYIGEFSIKMETTGWVNTPVGVFYSEEPHPEGSNYMGVYYNGTSLMIIDGISATEHEWDGVLNPETNEVIYSAFRHDMQEHNDLMVDGGPEYLRCNEDSTVVKLKIVKDKIEVSNIN